MGVVVAFDYTSWATRYPELATSVPQPLAQEYWNEATLYVRNDGGGPVRTAGVQSMLLNMVTAHIAALNASLNGEPATPLVGRLSSATEGSVTFQTENEYPPGSPQWFQSSKYGAAFWAATAAYRTARYMPGSSRVQPGVGPWWGGGFYRAQGPN